jgi:hypothetical protein
MELVFVEEEIPKIVRKGGSGREAEKWEEHLAPAKTPSKAGKSYCLWTYDKRTSAVSRMSSVRARLTSVTPKDNWELKVRPRPNSSEFGVYVQYNGTFTPAQMAENAQKREERSARTLASRKPTVVTDSTAKERVAAARQAKAS